MKRLIVLSIISIITATSFAQNNVGIGTTTPDASAALDISSSNKGVLFPKVFLLDTLDNTTIPNAAPNLIVFNTNTNLTGGKGLFYNKGTVYPRWEKVGQFKLPFAGTIVTNSAAFAVDNTGASSLSDAIQGYSTSGTAIKGISNTGTGVLAYSGSGNSLEVSGKIKIAGIGQAAGAGKVLTSDVNGNATWQGAIAFSSHGIQPGGAASFSIAETKKVAFYTEEYDLGDNYNPAAGAPYSTFTAPVKGIYHFDAAIVWSGEPNIYSHLFLVKNSNGNESNLVVSVSDTNGSAWPRTSISMDAILLPGDQVYLKLFQSAVAGGTETLSTGGENYFTGHLVVKL